MKHKMEKIEEKKGEKHHQWTEQAMCTTKSESQVGVKRRRVLRLRIKGGDKDRGKGVEGKAGEEGIE